MYSDHMIEILENHSYLYSKNEYYILLCCVYVLLLLYPYLHLGFPIHFILFFDIILMILLIVKLIRDFVVLLI